MRFKMSSFIKPSVLLIWGALSFAQAMIWGYEQIAPEELSALRDVEKKYHAIQAYTEDLRSQNLQLDMQVRASKNTIQDRDKLVAQYLSKIDYLTLQRQQTQDSLSVATDGNKKLHLLLEEERKAKEVLKDQLIMQEEAKSNQLRDLALMVAEKDKEIELLRKENHNLVSLGAFSATALQNIEQSNQLLYEQIANREAVINSYKQKASINQLPLSIYAQPQQQQMSGSGLGIPIKKSSSENAPVNVNKLYSSASKK